MTLDRDLRTQFDRVAELYDEVRPGYPEALIEDTITLSSIPPGGRILEIGAGTGKATLPFARRGYRMLCLELGARMAALAARNSRSCPHVEILVTAFEDWPAEPAAFQLVMSAQAFHWLDPEVRFQKAADCLRPGGALALLWNHLNARSSPLARALEEETASLVPSLGRTGRPSDLEELERLTVSDIEASGRFGPVAVHRYPWAEQQTAESYARGLSTSAPVLSLPEATRQRLLDGVRQTIESSGGTIETRYTAMLYVARIPGVPGSA